MAVYKCSNCKKILEVTDDIFIFQCYNCGTLHNADSSSEEANKTAELMRLTDVLKKAAAKKTDSDTFHLVASDLETGLSKAKDILDNVCLLGVIQQSQYAKMLECLRLQSFILNYLKEHSDVCSHEALRSAAKEGLALDDAVYNKFSSILSRLKENGYLEEPHLYLYCLPGVRDKNWLAKVDKYKNAPIDEEGLKLLKSMPFSYRKMRNEFINRMRPETADSPMQFVYFGNYYNEPILWRVLEIQGSRLLLISEFCIDNLKYRFQDITPEEEDNLTEDGVSWADSDIRAWLNGPFMDLAFSEKERNAITEVEISTNTISSIDSTDSVCSSSDMEFTRDYIYLLSADELNKYLPDYSSRYTEGSTHAHVNKINTHKRGDRHTNFINTQAEQYWHPVYWWLRSPWEDKSGVGTVVFSGVNNGKIISHLSKYSAGVRPVLWLDKSVLISDTADNECSSESTSEQVPAQIKDIRTSGQCVNFGHYEGAPISWQVLECDNNTALLISCSGLTSYPYHKTRNMWYVEYPTWENSDLRQWLNGDFLNCAFTSDEQQLICKSTVTASDNSHWCKSSDYYMIDGGNETQDNVFILSCEEALHYFKDNKLRCADIVPSAQTNYQTNWETGWNCFWWLRNPGATDTDASCVLPNGELLYCSTDTPEVTVRPVIRIKTVV